MRRKEQNVTIRKKIKQNEGIYGSSRINQGAGFLLIFRVDFDRLFKVRLG